MNQFFSFRQPTLQATMNSEESYNKKPKVAVDFNPYMTGFNNYYNNNDKLLSVMNQYYQDFNIINNTINSYSKLKTNPLEKRESELASKDYKTKVFKNSGNFTSRGETIASESTNFERATKPNLMPGNTLSKIGENAIRNLNTDRARMTSGYYNILAHDNTQEYKDSMRQNRILNEIKGNYDDGNRIDTKHHYANIDSQRLYNGKVTPDNNIVFINRDTIIRRPREFKTPPPPIYGEEEEYIEDPRAVFYDPIRDPNSKKFDFLDQRDGTISKHYKMYIKEKKKKKRKSNNDSISDSEKDDTIGDLPGLDIQQDVKNLHIKNKTFKPQSSGFNRALSYSPAAMKKFMYQTQRDMHHENDNESMHMRKNSFKNYAPKIITNEMLFNPIVRKDYNPNLKESNASRRPIRSGAFQRINSIDAIKKYN